MREREREREGGGQRDSNRERDRETKIERQRKTERQRETETEREKIPSVSKTKHRAIRQKYNKNIDSMSLLKSLCSFLKFCSKNRASVGRENNYGTTADSWLLLNNLRNELA